MAAGRPLDVEQELLEEFEHCGFVTEYLVRVLPSRVWRATPVIGRGRTIAAIVAHLYGVRRTFAKMGGATPPPSLDSKTTTQAEARRALQQVNKILVQQFRDALASGKTRVKGMPRRAVNMMVYLVQHDAHHRGQIAMRARELGHAFAADDVTKIWGWRKL